MTEDDYLRFEYEHLYNMRDQTLLFLEMCPDNRGYAEKIKEELNLMIREITRKM